MKSQYNYESSLYINSLALIMESKIKKDKAITELKCTVCLEASSSLKNMQVCASCDGLVCKSHWKKASGQTFCDRCIKNDIALELKPETSSDIQKLKSELHSLLSREDAAMTEINSKSLYIQTLENRLKDKQCGYECTLHMLGQGIKQASEEMKVLEEVISRAKQDIMDTENNISSLLEGFNGSTVELSRANRDYLVMSKDVDSLKMEVNEVVRVCNETIPYRRIRNITCIKCHENMKIQMREMIVGIIQNMRTQSLIHSVIREKERIQTRNGVPCTCLIS